MCDPRQLYERHLRGVTMTSSATQGIKTVLHPVTDLDKAKAVYTALLGAPPAFTDPDGNVLGLLEDPQG